jgi:hypothetical protein
VSPEAWLTLIVFSAAQAITSLWWASRLSTLVTQHEKEINGPNGLRDGRAGHGELLVAHTENLVHLHREVEEVKDDVRQMRGQRSA